MCLPPLINLASSLSATVPQDFLRGECIGGVELKLLLYSFLFPGVLLMAWLLLQLVMVPRLQGARERSTQRKTTWELALHITFSATSAVLFITFCMVSSISRTVLAAIGDCAVYDLDDGNTMTFLRDDFAVACDTSDHASIKKVAWALFVIWPVRMPTLDVTAMQLDVHRLYGD